VNFSSSSAAIIIPAYNHCRQVAAVVQRAKHLHLPIIVVDDGSTDATPAVLNRLSGIQLARHSRNLGKGAALLTGMRIAARWAQTVITIDADGQHDPADAMQLLECARKLARPGIVVGVRTGMSNRFVPETSRIGRRFSNLWVRCAGGPRLSDSQSGFRLYPLPHTLRLGARSRRFQFEIEVLVKARWIGLPVVETPVSVHYQPPGQRVSHFQPGLDFWRNSQVFSRLIFQYITQSASRRSLPSNEKK